MMKLNTIYRIKSHGGGGHYLTMSGSAKLTNNRNVYIAEEDSTLMQYWKVIQAGNSYKIVSVTDESFALNYYWSNGYGNTGNCDVYPHDGNTDAELLFEEAVHFDVYAYKIKLADDSLSASEDALYLTPASWDADSNVSWCKTDGSDVVQYWIFEEVTETTITFPSNRTYNWNQFYTDVTNAINSTAGCAWTCGLDVANIYGPQSYSPSSMANRWSSTGGYTWGMPSGCNAAFQGSFTTFSSNANYFNKIRTEIDNNRPVVIRTNNSSTNVNHFIVAYSYIENGNSTALIKVLDPARKTTETSIEEGRNVTLANSMAFNGKDAIIGLMLVTTDR